MKYIFDCRYESGGTAKIEVEWDTKYVWFSRNGGYRNRLADMPVEHDCLMPRFDFVTCTKQEEGCVDYSLSPVPTWEKCIDHICPDPEAYRAERTQRMRGSIVLADLQRALCLQDDEITSDPAMLGELIDAYPLDYHPMSGTANFRLRRKDDQQDS